MLLEGNNGVTFVPNDAILNAQLKTSEDGSGELVITAAKGGIQNTSTLPLQDAHEIKQARTLIESLQNAQSKDGEK